MSVGWRNDKVGVSSGRPSGTKTVASRTSMWSKVGHSAFRSSDESFGRTPAAVGCVFQRRRASPSWNKRSLSSTKRHVKSVESVSNSMHDVRASGDFDVGGGNCARLSSRFSYCTSDNGHGALCVAVRPTGVTSSVDCARRTSDPLWFSVVPIIIIPGLRAAVGIGIPMGIPTGMGMGWIWGLWWIPLGLWGFYGDLEWTWD